MRIKWRGVGYFLSTILYLLGVAQLIPFTVSILLNESPLFTVLLLVSSLTILLTAYIIRKHSVYEDIGLLEAFIIMVLAFIIPSFTCALPIIAYKVSFIDALFEGVSAITTTGLSALPEHALTPGVHFLRSYYQWLGGFSIAMLVISFLLTPGTAAYNIYIAHLGRFKITPLSISTVKAFLKIYVILTLVFIAMYTASGLTFFDSTINALTTISTGGFSTIDTFKGPVMYIALISMFISAQPLAIYYLLYKGEIRKMLRDPQLHLFSIILFISFTASLPLIHSGYLEYLFQLTSALSTTGYSALDNINLTDASKYLLSILMIIGAGFGSTGGGLKQLRLYIILRSTASVVKRQFMPGRAVIRPRIGGKIVSENEIIYAYTLFVLYIIVLIISTLIFTAHGYPLSDSLFETSSALATTGLSVGLSSPSLPLIPKIVLIIDMFLGRIEIMPALVIITYYLGKTGVR